VTDPLPPAPKASCCRPFPWAHFGNAWWLLDTILPAEADKTDHQGLRRRSGGGSAVLSAARRGGPGQPWQQRALGCARVLLPGDCESGGLRGNAARLGRRAPAVPMHDAGTGRADRATASRPIRQRSERSAWRLLDQESDSAGARLLARVRRSATALRDRMVGAAAAPEFVPKRNSAPWRPLDRRLGGLAPLVSTATPMRSTSLR
jgi:hypothetical protein